MTAEEAKQFTEQDIALARKHAEIVGESEKIKASEKWTNQESGISGRMTLLAIEQRDGTECKTLRFEAWKMGKSFHDDK
ncbi:MAG: hypothetical protein GY934_09195 [Gammaproteobacteria bacterium]|nr:hypothetical protein [Gammaproteobacteria bacterium]